MVKGLHLADAEAADQARRMSPTQRLFRVKTPRDALELVRLAGVVTVVPAGELPSLVVAVVGKPVEGSWWGHAQGKKIYRLSQQLLESPEVLAVKLVEGKVTFVHRALWPVLYRVVMDPERRRRALAGLSTKSRSLLTQVERTGLVRGDSEGYDAKSKEALEQRLLVLVGSIHTELGKHVTTLQAWRSWSTPALREEADSLEYARALDALRSAAGGAPDLGPWVY